MGQKVNPHGLRVGIIKDWDSKWYADKDYEKFLLEDIKIREFIKEKLFLSGISKVEIERASNRARISIHTAKPGMVIGRQGSNIELLKNDLKKMTDSVIDINIVEVKTPDMDATLVAENIASQLERLPTYLPMRLVLPNTRTVFTFNTFTLKICSTAWRISTLLAVKGTWKVYLLS